MKAYLSTITLFTFLFVASTAFSQGRGPGAGPSAGPGAGPSAGAGPTSQRGPSTLPAPTSSTPAPSKSSSAPKGSDASTKGADSGKGSTNKVGTEIADHPALSAKLQPLLPAGTNIDEASAGFKNMGQFIAAVHVSQNLNIPFDQLKAKVVTDKASLGDAIHALKPDEPKDQVTVEVKKAEAQAKDDTKKS